MTETLEFAKSTLAAQPFNGQVGGRITRFEPGFATLEIDIEDRLHQQYGVVHGGVLAYAADTALTFAAGTVLGSSIITAGMTISYLRAARSGMLRARASVVHYTKRTAVCRVEIDRVDGDVPDVLCAIAQGHVSTVAEPAK